jgi:hypothetical protein
MPHFPERGHELRWICFRVVPERVGHSSDMRTYHEHCQAVPARLGYSPV